MTTDTEELEARLAVAVARERTRLANALHDGVLQDLMVARQDLAEALAGDAASLAGLAGHLDRVTTTLRGLTGAMHEDALSEMGLAEALQRIARPVFDRGLLTVSVRVDPAADPFNDVVVREAVRQLLANVAEHASASTVGVSVEREAGVLTLRVADDGTGFDASRAARSRRDGHIGLPRVERLAERLGGSFVIGSGDPGGTVATLRLPLSALRVTQPQALLRRGSDALSAQAEHAFG